MKSLRQKAHDAARRRDEITERASARAATVYCTALNEIYAALGVTTQAGALAEIASLINSRDERDERDE